MPTIQPTRVSTETVDGVITVCKGFNMFAQGRAIDLAAEWNDVLIDIEPNLALYKFRLRVGFGVYAGICGPAYASDIVLEGTSNGATISLNASQSELLAGFEFGTGLRLIVLLDIWKLVIDAHWVSDGWSSHLEFDSHWDAVGRVGVDTTIDLLMIIARWLLTRGEAPVVTPARFPTGASLAMIDSNLTDLAKSGSATVEPKFFTLINVIDKVTALKPVVDLVAQIGGTIVAGPTVTLSAPTTVKVIAAATDGVQYGVATTNGMMTGTAAGASTVGPAALQLTMSHDSSIALSFGLGFTVTVLKIFSHSGYTPNIDLLSLLGITPHFGPFSNTIEAAYGAAAPPDRASRPATGCCYKVVLESPATAAAV